MERGWLKFLFLRLPVMLVLVAVVAEALAWGLRGVPPLRHPLDRLVYDLDHTANHATVVLMGDSVTQDVAGTFRIGDGTQVVNLTTNQASGMIGNYFLLRRYLEHNPTPRHVLIAGTPEAMGFTPQGPTAQTYLVSVFGRADEREDMRAMGLLTSSAPWKPAIMAFESRIFDRLIGLLRQEPRSLITGDALLTPVNPLEGPGGNAVGQKALAGRRGAVPELSSGARFALGRICALARERGIALSLAWAPIPQSVYRAWREDGRLTGFAATIRGVDGSHCAAVPIADFNAGRAFPDYAFRDPDHLRRPGWSQAYARQLDAFIRKLD